MAESHRNEIARLEALFSAHPEGRVFTHLAEAYRKAGELDRAREVLEGGLRRHPDYASAHVVLGRVLSDQGKVEEAASAFQRVLELDPQNLVALRASADLAWAAGRRGEALGYYREILLLDPDNEEVAGLVQGLEADDAAGGTEAAPAVPAGGAGRSEEDGERQMEPIGDTRDVGMESWWNQGAEGTGEVEAGDAAWAGESGTGPASPAESVFAEGGLAPADWEGPTGDAAGPFVGPSFEEGADLGSLADLPVLGEETAEWTGPVEPGVMDAAGEVPALEAEGIELAPAFEGQDPLAGELPSGSEAWLLEQGGEEDPGSELVTETMGDVYARQGLYGRAAEVYRQLLRARPGDERLESKLAAAEAQERARPASGEAGVPGLEEQAAVAESREEDGPFGSFEPEGWAAEAAGTEAPASGFDLSSEGSASGEPALLEIEAAWTGAAGAVAGGHTPYAWAEEAGPGESGGAAGEPSIGQYFQALLAWRPGAGEAVAAPGPPEGGVVSPDPVGPERTPDVHGAVTGGGDEIDQLFGADQVAPAASGSGPEEAEPPAEAQGGDDDDDLEMFRAWLQSLKR